MYLLILNADRGYNETYINLHPTMYLLIREIYPIKTVNEDNLHPTMYLLIRVRFSHPLLVLLKFTSHYVSINSP